MKDLIQIQNLIYVIRGQRVMLDSDLAMLYEVETKNLNRAVKRHIERFPENFMFQLTEEEWKAFKVRCQIVTSPKGGGRKYLSSLCFYRTRCSNVIFRFKFQKSNSNKHSDNEYFCKNA